MDDSSPLGATGTKKPASIVPEGSLLPRRGVPRIKIAPQYLLPVPVMQAGQVIASSLRGLPGEELCRVLQKLLLSDRACSSKSSDLAGIQIL